MRAWLWPLLAAILMLAIYAAQAPRTLRLALEDERAYTDFNPVEHDVHGEAFRWTGPEAQLRLPHLSSGPQIIALGLENIRPDSAPVALQLGQDLSADLSIPTGRRSYRILLPASAWPAESRLTLRGSTFRYPGESRELSLVTRSLSVTPAAGWPWWPLIAAGLLAQVLLLSLILAPYRLSLLSALAIPLQLGPRLNSGYGEDTALITWTIVGLAMAVGIIWSLNRGEQLPPLIRRWSRGDYLLAGAIALAGVALRIFLLPSQATLLNGDDYLTGAFALGILQGRQALYFGHHTGTLSAYLTAALFAVGGVSTTVMLILPILLSAILAVALYGVGRDLGGRWGGVTAALWISLPPSTPLWWTMKPQPGYLEAITCAALALWATLSLLYGEHRRATTIWLMVAAVACAALALWSGVVTISVLLICLLIGLINWQRLARLPLAGYGLAASVGLLVAVPTIIYIIERPQDNPLWWTFGRHLSGLPPGLAFVGLSTQLAPMALGASLQPQMSHPTGAAGLSVLIMTAVVGSYAIIRAFRGDWMARLGVALAAAVGAIFCFSSYNTLLNDARYILPLYIAYPLLLALIVRDLGRKWAAWAALALTLVTALNLWGGAATLAGIRQAGARNDLREIATTLSQEGLRYVHTSYWVAQPLMVESAGQIIATSTIGPNRENYDLRVDALVRAADPSQVAFALRQNGMIDQPFARYLAENQIACQRRQAGGLLIYHHCTPFPSLDELQDVLPAGIGL